MFTYLEQFERDFAKAPQAVIDASEGGVRKAGTRVMSLADAAGQCCTASCDARALISPAGEWDSPGKLAPGREAIESRLASLTEFRQLCQETRGLLVELQGLVKD